MLITLNDKDDKLLTFDKYRIVIHENDKDLPCFHFILLDNIIDLKISFENIEILNDYSWDDFKNEKDILYKWLTRLEAESKNDTNYIVSLIMWEMLHRKKTNFKNEWIH